MSNKMDKADGSSILPNDESDGRSILPNDESADKIVLISNLSDGDITGLLFDEDLFSNCSSIPNIFTIGLCVTGMKMEECCK